MFGEGDSRGMRSREGHVGEHTRDKLPVAPALSLFFAHQPLTNRLPYEWLLPPAITGSAFDAPNFKLISKSPKVREIPRSRLSRYSRYHNYPIHLVDHSMCMMASVVVLETP